MPLPKGIDEILSIRLSGTPIWQTRVRMRPPADCLMEGAGLAAEGFENGGAGSGSS